LDNPETVTVGRVGKSHGLDGSFVVENASEAPERFEVGAELLVEGEPAKVVARRHARGRPVIRLDRRVPRGAQLRVEEEGGDELGTVTDVIPGVANDVLELDSGLALPMVEDCVRVVDLATGRIVVAPGFAVS